METIITPFLLFCSEIGFLSRKLHRFVHSNPVNCLNKIVQSGVSAHCQEEQNSNPSFVVENLMLLGNSSYDRQIKDRSRHSVTRYMNNEKIHSVLNNKMFKRLGHINDQLIEVELAKSEIEHKETNIVVFLSSITLNWEFDNFFYKLLRYWQVWGDWNRYRSIVFSTSRKGTAWLYTKR